MVFARDLASTPIDGVVFVPLPERMRVRPIQFAKLAGRRRNHVINPKIAKYPVVAFARLLIGKQSEKQEYIASPNPHITKVRLRRATLTKQALAAREHRVFMAKMVPSDFAARNPFDNLA